MEQDKNQNLDYAQGVQDTLQTIFENQQKFDNNLSQDEVVTIDLSKIGRALLSKWWQVLLTTVIFAVLGFLVATFLVTPKYQSSFMVYVNNSSQKNQEQKTYSTTELQAAKSLVDTYIVILNSHTTLDTVIKNLGLSYGYEDLTSMISAKAQDETEIFSVTVTTNDPIEAQQIAKGIAEVLPTSISEVMEGSSIRIVDQPQLNPDPVSPSKIKYMLIFAFVGFVLIIAVVIILNMMDKKVSGEGDINALPDAPHILAAIPELDNRMKKVKKGNGYSYARIEKTQNGVNNVIEKEKIDDPYLCGNLSFEAQEAYKLLRTNIIFSLPDTEGCRIIGVTSGQQAETKTTTSINLSYFLAQTGKRVLLIEGDLRLPNIANRLKIKSKPGLSNFLGNFCNIRETVQKSRIHDNWYVMVGGDVPPNPSELIGSQRMANQLKDFRSLFDFIIVDLPPVGVVSDALVLAPSLDGISLVVRENYSLMPDVEEAIRRLNHKGVNLMGITYTGSNSTLKSSGYRKNSYSGYGA